MADDLDKQEVLQQLHLFSYFFKTVSDGNCGNCGAERWTHRSSGHGDGSIYSTDKEWTIKTCKEKFCFVFDGSPFKT